MEYILQPNTNIHIPTPMSVLLIASSAVSNMLLLQADMPMWSKILGWAVTLIAACFATIGKVMEIRAIRRKERRDKDLELLRIEYEKLLKQLNEK